MNAVATEPAAFTITFVTLPNGTRRYTAQTPTGEVTWTLSAKRAAKSGKNTAWFVRGVDDGKWYFSTIKKRTLAVMSDFQRAMNAEHLARYNMKPTFDQVQWVDIEI